MIENLNGRRVILASGSPRRHELLCQMGIDHEVWKGIDVDESYPEETKAKDVASFISKKKADAYAQKIEANDILITADTVVVADDKILGKPKDEKEAKDMLMSLQGRTHRVITGVVILTKDKRVEFAIKTKVTFRPLSEKTIEHYIASYHPLDKAGAYGIQEWIGIVGIDYIEGSYHNVMGLPTQRLFAELQNI
ncbi:MAG: septum formation protein Maf [Bacteroidales bacterium]|nr:septum formation protein Maf [Bacteroidales bacterium]